MLGFKTFKGQLILLLGRNAVSFKMKPFLIYHAENSRAMKHINKYTLSMYYHLNRKAWMTGELFGDQFINCFIPKAEEYCEESDEPFKTLSE